MTYVICPIDGSHFDAQCERMEAKKEITELTLVRKKVWDPWLRFLHAWNGCTVLLLMLTGWSADLFEDGFYKKAFWLIHIRAGYALGLGLLFRILWGLVGPPEARFKDFWHLKSWIGLFKTAQKHSRPFGHDPLASLAYIAFYLLITIAVVSGLGLAAIEQGRGPLTSWLFDSVWLKDFFEEPHEFANLAIALFAAIHITALILHEKLEGTPMTGAMFSGFQYRKKKEINDEKTNTLSVHESVSNRIHDQN